MTTVGPAGIISSQTPSLASTSKTSTSGAEHRATAQPHLNPEELAARRREVLSNTLDETFNKILTLMTTAFEKLKTFLLETLTPAAVKRAL